MVLLIPILLPASKAQAWKRHLAGAIGEASWRFDARNIRKARKPILELSFRPSPVVASCSGTGSSLIFISHSLLKSDLPSERPVVVFLGLGSADALCRLDTELLKHFQPLIGRIVRPTVSETTKNSSAELKSSIYPASWEMLKNRSRCSRDAVLVLGRQNLSHGSRFAGVS